MNSKRPLSRIHSPELPVPVAIWWLKFARTYGVIRRLPIGGRTYRAVSIGLDWRVALHPEFCLNQSLNYSKDHSGCDAKHEHPVGCFKGAQESPAGRDHYAAVSDRRVRGRRIIKGPGKV